MKERLVIKTLKHNHIAYDLMLHSQTFSSMKTAQVTHTKGMEFAKPVIVNIDGEMVMAVLPANYSLDLEKLKVATGAALATMATEEEFRYRFDDSTIGAMPPFGNLYGMKVLMDTDMKNDENIAFNACNHQEIIKMKFSDYTMLAHPSFMNLHRS